MRRGREVERDMGLRGGVAINGCAIIYTALRQVGLPAFTSIQVLNCAAAKVRQ
jgi:hypothetical protein